jgi:hypothetical protein
LFAPTSKLEEDDELHSSFSFTIIEKQKQKKRMMMSSTVVRHHFFSWKITKTTMSSVVVTCTSLKT